jgi:hypothetical protein
MNLNAKTFAHNTKLETLVMENMNLQTLSADVLRPLVNLQTIDIANNNFTCSKQLAPLIEYLKDLYTVSSCPHH